MVEPYTSHYICHAKKVGPGLEFSGGSRFLKRRGSTNVKFSN